MSEENHKIRSDLLISRQVSNHEITYVLKRPENNRFFRFGEIEYFIITQLNGANSIAAICARVEEKYKAPLSEQSLLTFITSLQQRGLLYQQNSATRSTYYHNKRFRGNWFHLRFNFFDPDHLLTYLVTHLKFLFSKSFILGSTAFFFVACILFGINYEEIQQNIVGELALENVIAVGFVLAITALLHELCHGLSCKHYDGEVKEIGFLLIFFMPAFYCNISDAWLFPEKSKRLWVAFAGAYCELLLWAVAVFCWRIFAPETTVYYLTLIVIATSGVRILLNFNPLIKLDGYYMLSDFLDIPNLRSKALSYLTYRIKRLFGKNILAMEVTRRERTIFLVYGAMAGMFSLFILGYLASMLATFLMDQLQGIGFIIFVGILAMIFHKKLKNSLAKIPSINGNFFQNKWFGKIPPKYGLVTLSLLLLFFLRFDLTVSGEFEVYPIHNADIRAEVEAIIDDIYVREGDRVSKGDKLAHLSDREYQMELHKLQADIQERQAQLKMLTIGATQEEIASARSKVETAKTRYQHASKSVDEAEHIHSRHISKLQTSVTKAREQLSFAEKKLQRVSPLMNKQVVPLIAVDEVQKEVSARRNEFREAEAELRVAQANQHAERIKELAVSKTEIEQAEADLKKLLAGNRPEQIEAIEAEIKALGVQQSYIKNNLKRVLITSPVDGIVTTPKVQETLGQLVKQGDLIMEVYHYDTAEIEMLIPEKEIGDVRIGQSVELKARAYPDKSFQGVVTAIAPTAMQDQTGLTRKVIRVITEIDNPDLLLKKAMTGHAKISCGQHSLVDLLTRRFIRYLKVEFWALW